MQNEDKNVNTVDTLYDCGDDNRLVPTRAVCDLSSLSNIGNVYPNRDNKTM